MLPLPSDLAGLESTRNSFYGAERSKKLGLKLLPSLADHDIYASGPDLEVLRNEVLLLLSHLEPNETEYWSYRLRNILHAIDVASAYDDGEVNIG